MTSPSGSSPWQAANVDTGDGGIGWYSEQGEAEWKTRIFESATKSLLSLGMWALKVPLMDDLTEAITGDGEIDLNNDGIPDLQQVTEFLQSKWELVENIGDAVELLTEAFVAIIKAAGGDFSDITKLPEAALEVIRKLIRTLSGGLLGNIELGQLFRAQAGAERNWLEGFDSPESIVPDANWSHDATVGRTKLGSAKCVLDGAEHVQTSDAIDAAPGQPLSVGGYPRWSGFTGTGAPAFILRALAYNSGDQLIGSQQIGAVTPSVPDAPDFETVVSASWTPPSAVKYVRVRMECTAAATGGTVHWDDLWLRKPAQSLPQQWIANLVGDLGNLGDGISDAWNFVQSTIDNFMNGRGILGSLFSLSHFQEEVGKVFGPGSNIPKNLIDGLDDALGLLLPKTDWSKFLTGFTAAGNNGTTPSTGIPALDGLINSFLGVRSTATGAQSAAATVQGTVQVQAVTVGTVDGLTVVRTPITSTQNWTRAAIPVGCTERVKTGVGLVASGQGGGRGYALSGDNTNGYSSKGGSPGVGGGYVYAEFDPATVGTSQTVTIGAGGAGSTSLGVDGAFGGATSFGSLLAIASGAGGGIVTSIGAVSGAGSAGNGGAGGDLVVGAASFGQQGAPAYRVQGGASAGAAGGTGGNGQNAPTSDDILTGGSGGGGGGARNATIFQTAGPGGNGGIPGGGGAGGGGGGNGNSAGNGGNGARGEALVSEYFR